MCVLPHDIDEGRDGDEDDHGEQNQQNHQTQITFTVDYRIWSGGRQNDTGGQRHEQDGGDEEEDRGNEGRRTNRWMSWRQEIQVWWEEKRTPQKQL